MRFYLLERRLGRLIFLLMLWHAQAALALGPLGGGLPPGLPQMRMPGLATPMRGLQPLDAVEHVTPLARTDDLAALVAARAHSVATLLARHPDLIEVDPAGNPARRGELVVWSPAPATLERVLALGFQIRRQQQFGELGAALVTLAVPPGLDTARALQQLRSADPDGEYDFNHLYTGSASVRAAPDELALPGAAPTPPGRAVAPPAKLNLRVGLIDSGVSAEHPALRRLAIVRHGCGERVVPSAHGSAVASLMVGADGDFHGALPGARLYAADVYCGAPDGGSVAQIVDAMGWLSAQQVPVINLSLVGPANRLLEHAVALLVARGYLLTAAVGNDGPNAPPLYPASYPGVIGVTAVDANGHALPEAARGAQVMFGAPGSALLAADAERGYQRVRGTSFAAPIVAALLAARLSRADPLQAHAALQTLLGSVVNPQHRRSAEIGFGIVGLPAQSTAAAP